MFKILSEKMIAIMLIAVSLSFAGIIPADRQTDWSHAGVEGGIPNRTTIYTTLNPGATAAEINAAIAACPADQVVYLNAGTYNLDSQIRMRKSHVVLRGAGPGKTILNLISPIPGSASGGSFIWMGMDNWYIYSDRLPVVDIQSGATRDSKSIVVSDASGIEVGDMLVIDELNDSTVTYVLAPGYLSRQNGTRMRGQMAQVTGVSGSTVTLSDPLYMTYDVSLAPQAVIIKNSIVTRWCGIENMTLTQPDSNTNAYYGSMIALECAENSWVRNVEVANINSMGITATASLHTEFRNNYIHDSSIEAAGAWIPLSVKGRFGNSYGYAFLFNRYNSGGLVVNNIIKNVGPGFEMIGLSSGNVLAFNYAASILYNNAADNFLGFDQGSHGGFPMLNLWESNIGYKISSDNTNGSAGYNTFFREYSKGYIGDHIYHGSVAVSIMSGNLSMNAIGNVLGTSGRSNLYESNSGDAIYADPWPKSVYPVWHIGYWGSGHAADSLPGATLLRWGNFDYATNTTRWEASEIPSGVPVPSTHTLPASMFLSSKPDFFTTPWGTPAWPAIGPDVSGGQDPAGHAQKLPSQLCYENTIAKGLSFDPNTCYPAKSAGISQKQSAGQVSSIAGFTGLSTSGVRFFLPQESNVKLAVYDVAGKQIRTLMSGHQKAGSHSVSHNGKEWPAGIHLVRLEAGSFSDTRKLVSVR